MSLLDWCLKSSRKEPTAQQNLRAGVPAAVTKHLVYTSSARLVAEEETSEFVIGH